MGIFRTALQRIVDGPKIGQVHERAENGPGGNISVVDWAKMFAPGGVVSYGGSSYQAYALNASGGQGVAAYTGNSVVFACQANRMLLFSEARFQWQQLRNGRPGELFGSPDLATLEQPWVGASTRDLLAQADLDVLTAGNSYWVRDEDPRYLLRLNPANVTIITEGSRDPVYGAVVGDRLLAYAYKVDRDRTVFYEPYEVAHYKPYPDPRNRFVGMSWLNPCLPDVEADASMTEHKRSAVQGGANLGYVVTVGTGGGPGPTPQQFAEFVANYRAQHEGPANAGKTLFLGPGSDVKTVGQTLENLDMKATQGAGETRIAACSGVPPVIVGLSEGLSSATYSNYGQARRRLVDGTMRPLWGFFASAMQSIFPPPQSGARLWYDDRDIPFLREDVKDQAAILAQNVGSYRQLIDAGVIPDAAARQVGLPDLVGQHTGLFSVQLQPPGTETTPTTPPVRATLSLPEIFRREDGGWKVLELSPAGPPTA